MCYQYSKLPTEEVEREEKREKTNYKTETEKQVKWKKMKKAAKQFRGILIKDLGGTFRATVGALPTVFGAIYVLCVIP